MSFFNTDFIITGKMFQSEFNRRLTLILIAFAILSGFSAVKAQVLEPRSYSNIPVGMNFLLAAYSYNSGGVLFDPSIPIENANIKIHGTALAYARSVKMGKLLGKFDMIIPYAWLSGTAEFMEEPAAREVSGLGDPSVRMSVNFIGAPALSLAEFKNYKQNFILGASLQVNMPLGQYDPLRIVNLGTNRFTFKPELGISKTIGPLFLDLAAAVAIYTINHDFNNGKTISQAPIGSVQGHVIYTFTKGMWAAIDGTYYWGGSTTMDGVKGDNLQENTRLGFTFVMPFNIHNSIKFNFSTGVITRTGTDFNTIAIAWQYRWNKEIAKR
jgi:hypothetical protein